jgi:hypothetical protein
MDTVVSLVFLIWLTIAMTEFVPVPELVVVWAAGVVIGCLRYIRFQSIGSLQTLAVAEPVQRNPMLRSQEDDRAPIISPGQLVRVTELEDSEDPTVAIVGSCRGGHLELNSPQALVPNSAVSVSTPGVLLLGEVCTCTRNGDRFTAVLRLQHGLFELDDYGESNPSEYTRKTITRSVSTVKTVVAQCTFVLDGNSVRQVGRRTIHILLDTMKR